MYKEEANKSSVESTLVYRYYPYFKHYALEAENPYTARRFIFFYNREVKFTVSHKFRLVSRSRDPKSMLRIPY